MKVESRKSEEWQIEVERVRRVKGGKSKKAERAERAGIVESKKRRV